MLWAEKMNTENSRQKERGFAETAGLFFGEIKNTGALYEKVHFLPVFEVNRKIKTKDNKIEIKINRTIIKKDTKGCLRISADRRKKGERRYEKTG